MQSDKRQTSNSYLRNSLVDGVRPYYYREGVRSLLGFPESGEGKMAFSPTLPAIGFKYVNRPLLNELHSIQDSRNETDRFASISKQEGETENSLVSLRKNIQSYEPIDEVSLKNPDLSEKSHNREMSQQKDSIKERVQQDSAVPEPEQNGSSGAMKETSEEGNMASSLTLPAVRFRFVNHPLLNKLHSVQHPKNNIDRFASNSDQEGETENSLVTHWENSQFCKPVDEIRLKNPTPPEKNHNKEMSQQKDSKAEKVRQDNAVPEPKQNQGFEMLKEILEDPGVIVQKSIVEIPCISKKNSTVPSMHRKEWNTQSNSHEEIVPQKVSPASSSEDFIKSSSSEAQKNRSTINPQSTSVPATRSLQRTGVINEKTAVASSTSKMESSLADDIAKAVEGKTTTAQKDGYSQIMTPFSVVAEEKCTSRPNQPADSTPSRSRYIDADALSKANRNASDRYRIEQLQHAVHQLASTVSSQGARMSHVERQERFAQTQTPPVKPVVIIKRFSSQTSSPCAFWERSYLSRFHLKSLR